MISFDLVLISLTTCELRRIAANCVTPPCNDMRGAGCFSHVIQHLAYTLPAVWGHDAGCLLPLLAAVGVEQGLHAQIAHELRKRFCTGSRNSRAHAYRDGVVVRNGGCKGCVTPSTSLLNCCDPWGPANRLTRCCTAFRGIRSHSERQGWRAVSSTGARRAGRRLRHRRRRRRVGSGGVDGMVMVRETRCGSNLVACLWLVSVL